LTVYLTLCVGAKDEVHEQKEKELEGEKVDADAYDLGARRGSNYQTPMERFGGPRSVDG
jgi:hypothetical protein